MLIGTPGLFQWIDFECLHDCLVESLPSKKSVPVHRRVTDNSLKDFKFWYFDDISYGAVIVYDSDDFLILDPMYLQKFGKDDMMVLHDNPIHVFGGYDPEAKPFTKVVALDITHKHYAGAVLIRQHSVSIDFISLGRVCRAHQDDKD
ncbi:hypothetical protein R6Q57_009113 [Mikania cordata]